MQRHAILAGAAQGVPPCVDSQCTRPSRFRPHRAVPRFDEAAAAGLLFAAVIHRAWNLLRAGRWSENAEPAPLATDVLIPFEAEALAVAEVRCGDC